MQVLQKHWLHSVFRLWEGAIIYFLHLYSATSFYSRRRAGSCCSENKRTTGLMSFKCLWCVFPAISMETLRRESMAGRRLSCFPRLFQGVRICKENTGWLFVLYNPHTHRSSKSMLPNAFLGMGFWNEMPARNQ